MYSTERREDIFLMLTFVSHLFDVSHKCEDVNYSKKKNLFSIKNV